MVTYISILRGINVSGQKKIMMKDLTALYEVMGFKNVVTYVQSGNVIFDCNKIKTASISKKIETKIFETYNFYVPVIIRTVDEMQSVLTNNPYLKKSSTEEIGLHVTFLAEHPTQVQIDKTNEFNFAPDKFMISGNEVYLYCPISYGNSKLSNNFFENKLNVRATTRNWKTVNELVRLATEK